jgi:hypothetical protein
MHPPYLRPNIISSTHRGLNLVSALRSRTSPPIYALLFSPTTWRAGPRFCISQEQGSLVTPRALGSHFIAFHDMQCYGGSILTRLHTWFVVKVKFKVIFWPTASRQVYHGIRPPCETRDQLFFPFSGNYLQTFAFILITWCHLWREDRSVILSAVTSQSEPRRTHNHTLLSNLRLQVPVFIPPCWHIYTRTAYKVRLLCSSSNIAKKHYCVRGCYLGTASV